MLDANQLRKGATFLLDGKLYQVLEYQHHKPGRGNAIIRTKLRDLRSGTILRRNFLDNDRFEEAPVERRTFQYLYKDGEFYYFMDTETYDQTRIPQELIKEKAGYLKESKELVLVMLNNESIDIELPPTVELEIIEAEMAVVGDTATGAQKSVTCETGLKVSVPLFVEAGDVIRVDTRSGEYVTRV